MPDGLKWCAAFDGLADVLQAGPDGLQQLLLPWVWLQGLG